MHGHLGSYSRRGVSSYTCDSYCLKICVIKSVNFNEAKPDTVYEGPRGRDGEGKYTSPYMAQVSDS